MPLAGKALAGTGSVLLGMQNPFARATEHTLATRSVVRAASTASLVSACTRLSHMVHLSTLSATPAWPRLAIDVERSVAEVAVRLIYQPVKRVPTHLSA